MFDPIAYINEPRWQNVSLGLARTRELLEGLGAPQDSLRFVHVAGTNGKGSTCAFIASMLQQAGYRVGLFTSPALYCFEDRIRVDGTNITPSELLSVTEQVKEVADAMEEHPTEFELLTAVAFCHFVRKQCDIVVVEVGLGGRLDSTNVIESPEVSVITPISFDHRALLGDTLFAIAREKAGIIKPGAPVVSAPQEQSVRDVIEEVARARGTTVERVDLSRLEGSQTCFSYRDRKDLSLGLSGDFQLMNAACALETIDQLQLAGWEISEQAVRAGLAAARWPGRFEVVSDQPLVILDGGHNIAGMDALIHSLDAAYPDHYRIMLTGVLADKDHEEMGALLVRGADEIITITPPNPRALSADRYASELEEACRALGQAEGSFDGAHDPLPAGMPLITAAPDFRSGVERSLIRAEAARARGVVPLVCVCGSLYLLGAVMEVLRQVGVAL